MVTRMYDAGAPAGAPRVAFYDIKYNVNWIELS